MARNLDSKLNTLLKLAIVMEIKTNSIEKFSF